MTPEDAKLLHHGLITLAKSIDKLVEITQEDMDNERLEMNWYELAAPAKTELAMKELGL